MNAVEFTTELTNSGLLQIPAEAAARLPEHDKDAQQSGCTEPGDNASVPGRTSVALGR